MVITEEKLVVLNINYEKQRNEEMTGKMWKTNNNIMARILIGPKVEANNLRSCYKKAKRNQNDQA